MEREKKRRGVPFFDSLQVKYALSYMAVFEVILVLLNTYHLIASEDLLFTSKRDALKGQVNMMSSTLMELESLSREQVIRVMNLLDDGEADQVIVTDPAGQIRYDSRPDEMGQGESVLPDPNEPVRYAV